MSMLIDAYRYGSGPPPGPTLFSELIADGPVNYWRNAEASTAGGMIDEVAADGSYVGSPSLGNAALYSGGPTCASAFDSINLGNSSVFPSSLAEMTIVSVQKWNSLASIQPIGVQRDENASGRMYQFRTSGSDIQFVRITGGVGVYQVTGVLSTGVSYIIGCEVDSSGNVTIYLNGTPQSGSWTVGAAAAADFGGSGDQYQIGYSTGISNFLDGFTCENAVFDYCPGATRQAAYATAAGL